jgi:REP element-mobilizing transposase RayT
MNCACSQPSWPIAIRRSSNQAVPEFPVPELPADVFLADIDRIRYLAILREHSLRRDLRILGWCLMTNHIHLIAIPGAAESMSLALGEAHSRYTLELNRQHDWGGIFGKDDSTPARWKRRI